MRAEWGTLSEPTIPVPDIEEASATEQRAAKSSPGSWSEDLGKYGSEPWRLPGYGDSGPKCGIWYPDSVCGDCGHVDMNNHNCGRRSCPDCWGIWAKEASARATVRLQAYRHTKPNDYRRQAAHAVISPSEGDVMTKREFFEGKSKAAEIAQEKGFRGCAVVAHPWRVVDDAKQRYRDLDLDVGLWVWLRQEFDEHELKEKVYWSPHYHVIGPTTPDMDAGGDGEDWLYRFIRSVKPMGSVADKEAHNDVYGAFRYLLSHTGYPEGSTKQAITWYGNLANAVFVEDATQDYQIAKPSEGVMDALERHVAEVADVDVDEEGSAGDDDRDDEGDCPRDCEGVLIDVFDVTRYLRHNEPPPEVADRMELCRDWRLGDVQPPPGLKRPQCEQDARDALDAML